MPPTPADPDRKRPAHPATPGPPAADPTTCNRSPADVPPPARRSPPTIPGIHPQPTPGPEAAGPPAAVLLFRHPPRRRSHAKGPGAHAPRPFFCTHHQPQPAQADAASRRKSPVLAHPAPRDKSQAPIQRPSQPRFCPFCVIPRHHRQSPFLPFSHPPDTALLYPLRSYPDPRYSVAQ